jgi:hypothetical protein
MKKAVLNQLSIEPTLCVSKSSRDCKILAALGLTLKHHPRAIAANSSRDIITKSKRLTEHKHLLFLLLIPCILHYYYRLVKRKNLSKKRLS